ncbi:hypothetical protein EYF80_041389 [Liparis tanakae]|uniref:Uncharacterized protein n=1 Tax=Liparis tanakae TaxID=230148 RepID=A0A4Z2G697_9TELE|nr:hypothetical protein EYF80_041389 [Liparis tanakae]
MYCRQQSAQLTPSASAPQHTVTFMYTTEYQRRVPFPSSQLNPTKERVHWGGGGSQVIQNLPITSTVPAKLKLENIHVFHVVPGVPVEASDLTRPPTDTHSTGRTPYLGGEPVQLGSAPAPHDDR